MISMMLCLMFPPWRGVTHEYLNDLEEEYEAIALLTKSKRFFKKDTQSSPQRKPELRPTKDFEAKYNKVKAKLALLSSSASASKAQRDGNKTRTRWGPDPQTRIDWGIPELTGDGDGDGESPNYKTGDGAGMGIT
ncbi:hypothetical protein Tco_1152478 [Tanacetum coccineum]